MRSNSKRNSKSRRSRSKAKPGESTVPAVTGMKGGSGSLAYLNVTPMIDVMLVLLIIFMVITPVLLSHSVTLPKAITATAEKGNRVTLTINKQGQFFMEHKRQPIPLAQLTAKLRQAYISKPNDHVLYLKADNSVRYSVVLTAINAARAAGVVRIGAITQTEKAPKPNKNKRSKLMMKLEWQLNIRRGKQWR